MERIAWAAWAGGLKNGTGTVTTESCELSNTRYGYQARFEAGPGTNPEELIAAAHAASYSMTLATQLEDSGFKPVSISTRAALTLEKVADAYAISEIHLDTAANVPAITAHVFQSMALQAQSRCLVSKQLKARITVAARLEN